MSLKNTPINTPDLIACDFLFYLFIHKNRLCCKYNHFYSTELFYFLKKILFIFSERGMEGEREGEEHQNRLPLARPYLGTWATTQACALTGNQICDLLLCGIDVQLTEPQQSGLLLNFSQIFFLKGKFHHTDNINPSVETNLITGLKNSISTNGTTIC